MLLEVDADGEGPDDGDLAAAGDFKALVVDLGFERAVDRVEEVLAVIAQVKAKQIVAEKAVEQLFLPRKSLEHLAAGPGNVPELADDESGIALLEKPGQQSKMVILNEHERRISAGFLEC